MLRHFQNLLKWKCLQVDLESESSIQPLTIIDFLTHVMVPEAAILLIMEDEGWNMDADLTSEGYRTAWVEASRLRATSVEYGRWRFRAEGLEAEATFEDLDQTRPETKRLAKQVLASAKTRKCTTGPEVDEIMLVISSSQSSDESVIAISPTTPKKTHRIITSPETDSSFSTSTQISPLEDPKEPTTRCPIIGRSPRLPVLRQIFRPGNIADSITEG